MKKIFTLFAFVLLAVSIQARPFVEEGKTWFMEERSPQASLYPEKGIPSKFYTLKMEGDSLIGGTKWKRVFTNYHSTDGSFALMALVREENGRVYMLPFSNSAEAIMIYDFDMDVNEKVMVTLPENVSPILWGAPACDMHQYEMYLTKRYSEARLSHELLINEMSLLMEGYHQDFNYTWIDGVGNPYGPFSMTHPEAVGAYSKQVVKCTVGEEVLYEAQAWDITGIDTITPIDNKCSDTIHDLSGRRLPGIPKTGIYIQGGKKHWAK